MAKDGTSRGRPTKYDPALLEKLWDYIENPTKYNDPVPTIEGACDELGISKQTAYNWSKENDDFLDAMDALLEKQGRLLQSYGLLGKTNPAITKLMLSANHGMREKNDLEVSGKDGQPIDSTISVTVKHV